MATCTILVARIISFAVDSTVDHYFHALQDAELNSIAELYATATEYEDVKLGIYANFILFKRTNQLALLENAINEAKRWVELPDSQENYSRKLRLVVHLLSEATRFKLGAGDSDELRSMLNKDKLTLREELDFAIDMAYTTLEATPERYSGRYILLNDLGCWLAIRYRLIGLQRDLDEAIDTLTLALKAVPGDNDNSPLIRINLATWHYQNFLRNKMPKDLGCSIALYSSTLQSERLNNALKTKIRMWLAACYHQRFQLTHMIDDLRYAIELAKESFHSMPYDDEEYVILMYNIGIRYSLLFRRTYNPDHWQSCFDYVNAASQFIPQQHPAFEQIQSSKGEIQKMRYEAVEWGASTELPIEITYIAPTPTGNSDATVEILDDHDVVLEIEMEEDQISLLDGNQEDQELEEITVEQNKRTAIPQSQYDPLSLQNLEALRIKLEQSSLGSRKPLTSEYATTESDIWENEWFRGPTEILDPSHEFMIVKDEVVAKVVEAYHQNGKLYLEEDEDEDVEEDEKEMEQEPEVLEEAENKKVEATPSYTPVDLRGVGTKWEENTLAGDPKSIPQSSPSGQNQGRPRGQGSRGRGSRGGRGGGRGGTGGTGGASGSSGGGGGGDGGSRKHLRDDNPDPSDNGAGDDDGDGDGDRGKRQNVGTRKQIAPGELRLACPFQKKYPEQFEHICSVKGYMHISHLKQHIHRSHKQNPNYCPNCWEVFATVKLKDEHIKNAMKGRVSCQERSGSRDSGGLPYEKLAAMGDRVSAKDSLEEQWFSLWDFIFDGARRPATCTVDLAPGMSAQVLGYQQFFEQEGIEIVMQTLREKGLLYDREEDEVDGQQLRVCRNYIRQVFRDSSRMVFDEWKSQRQLGTPSLAKLSTLPTIASAGSLQSLANVAGLSNTNMIANDNSYLTATDYNKANQAPQVPQWPEDPAQLQYSFNPTYNPGIVGGEDVQGGTDPTTGNQMDMGNLEDILDMPGNYYLANNR